MNCTLVSSEDGDVDHGAGNIVDIHCRLDFDRAVGLRHTLFHARGHIGRGIANVDPTTGDVILTPIEARSLWSAQ